MPIVFYVSIQGKIRIDVDHLNFCKDPKNTDKIKLYILSTFLTASMLRSAVLQVEKLLLRVRKVRSLGVLNICTLFNQFKNWTGLSHVTQMSCKDTLNFY